MEFGRNIKTSWAGSFIKRNLWVEIVKVVVDGRFNEPKFK